MSDEQENNKPPRKPVLCPVCYTTLTWREQRKQFGRLIRKGYSKEEIKAIVPRCSCCTTKWIIEHLRNFAAPTIADQPPHVPAFTGSAIT